MRAVFAPLAALLLLAVASTTAMATAPPLLSIHNPLANTTERSLRIASLASQIHNAPRSVVVSGMTYPLYVGPSDDAPGSLAHKIQMQELAKLKDFGLPTSEKVAKFAKTWIKTFRTVDDVVTFYQNVLDESPIALEAQQCAKKFATINDFTTFYDQIAHDLEKPWSTDNSDATFGAQRMVMKGFTMRLVGENEFFSLEKNDEITITNTQLRHHCGGPKNVTKQSLRVQKRLFVTELDNIAQYNDPQQKHRKYVPNVIGFFCFNNDTQQLLPMEIKFPETGISYTPFDTKEEWTLAKMGLEAAEIDFQNMAHMAETHAMTIPMRVEAYRSMDTQHPVFQLFTHHVFADFALEMLSEKLLLNISTEVDQTFGFGATGSLRFIYDRMTQNEVYVSVENDFYTDLKRRGLDNIPTHKYVQYGKLYYAAFDGFVESFLNVYYENDDQIIQDVEIQNWAKGCSQVPHLRGFPSSFTSKTQLRKLLTHIIFQSTFKHHAMNGLVSWHGVSMPYAVPALWHPLPRAKLVDGEHLDLMKYTIPTFLVAEQVRSPAAFYRAIPLSETLLDAYRDTPFASEPRLAEAIRSYETALRAIDRQLASATEASAPQPWPSHLYRPSKLAYYTWI